MRPAGVRLFDGVCGFLEGSVVLVVMAGWFGILCLNWFELVCLAMEWEL